MRQQDKRVIIESTLKQLNSAFSWLVLVRMSATRFRVCIIQYVLHAIFILLFIYTQYYIIYHIVLIQCQYNILYCTISYNAMTILYVCMYAALYAYFYYILCFIIQHTVLYSYSTLYYIYTIYRSSVHGVMLLPYASIR